MFRLGRPSTYTQAIADEICRRLAEGESLRSICRDEHMPPASTVCGWVYDNNTDFSVQYARARNIALDLMAEEIVEIADLDGDANRDRLRVDTRKWLMSKLAHKKYGDKLVHEGGETPIKTVVEWAKSER